MTTPRAGLALVLAALLAACSSAPELPEPTPLQPVVAKVEWRQAWQQRLEGVQAPLTIAVDGDTFTLASVDGTVLSVQADDGRERWRTQLDARLGAGVGSDGRHAAVVSTNGDLIVLEQGRVLWRKRLPTQVVTAPLVAGGRVFVLALDRSVHAYDALDGRKLWSFQRPGDPLTLLQPGVLLPFKNTLLVGQGPRLVALDPLDGKLRWDVALATPRGTNEVERLAELVAPAARIGNTVCARAFQAALGCVDAEQGRLLWTRPGGGTDGVAAASQMIVGADATDRVSGWRIGGGEAAWSLDNLRYRRLGSPVSVGDAVVFGDDLGTLHWLAGASGETLLRLPTDGSGFAVTPVWSGRVLLVATRAGSLYAFRPDR